MKDGFARLSGRFRAAGAARRARRVDSTEVEDDIGAGPAAESRGVRGDRWTTHIGSAALAFRGYDVTNLGRSRELLEHHAYGPIVAGNWRRPRRSPPTPCREPIDLAAYVRASAPTSLDDFPVDVALIVAIELAQLRLLDEFFGVETHHAKMSIGYSIGELSAMVHGGSFTMEELLPVPLAMAEDCAALAGDVRMAILFTRSPVLPEADVGRMCQAVSGEGLGLIAPSAFLSPNTVLLLGQGQTIDRVEAVMRDYLPAKVMLRRNPNRWPPLHTPLVRLRNVPNRTASALYAIPGMRPAPVPPVVSCVTGRPGDEVSCRETLIQWTERPQRLWDAIDAVLTAGVEAVIHVGPSPNLIPATFARLSNNVDKSLNNKFLRGFGRGVATSMNRHAWLATLLPHRAALLRAPLLTHVILEDWLLEQPMPDGRS